MSGSEVVGKSKALLFFSLALHPYLFVSEKEKSWTASGAQMVLICAAS